MAVVWEFLLHPSVGLINLVLDQFGIPGRNWLKNPNRALFALAGIGIWQSLGLNMVLFLAGLKAIPRDLYEAAASTAPTAWERFRRVTWPMLGPATLFVLVIIGDPLVPGLRHRRGADQGRPEQGDRGAALYDVHRKAFNSSAPATAPRSPWCSWLRAGLTLLQVSCSRSGCTTHESRPPSALRGVPPPRAAAGAVIMLAPFVWMCRRR